MKNLMLVVGLAVALPVFANSKDGGNGGDVVVCPNSVELLDSFEMRERGLKIDLPAGSRSDKVQAMLARYERIHTSKKVALRIYAEDFESAIQKYESSEMQNDVVNFISGVLRDVPDSQETYLPYGCELKQLIIQQEPSRINPRYVIDKVLWKRLDKTQQALAVMHEAWYRLDISMGAIDSRSARYVNGLYASSKGTPNNVSEAVATFGEVEIDARELFPFLSGYDQNGFTGCRNQEGKLFCKIDLKSEDSHPLKFPQGIFERVKFEIVGFELDYSFQKLISFGSFGSGIDFFSTSGELELGDIKVGGSFKKLEFDPKSEMFTEGYVWCTDLEVAGKKIKIKRSGKPYYAHFKQIQGSDNYEIRKISVEEWKNIK